MARYDFLYRSRGQNNKVVPVILRDGECELARNVNIDTIGRWQKRYGTSLKNAQIVDGNTILGLYNFITSGGTSYHLAAINDSGDANSDVFLDVGGTWTIKLQNWTKDVRIRFVTFLNRVIAFNGSDAPKSSADGSTWDSTGLTDAPTAKYGVIFRARVYFAANSTYPDRVWFSNVGKDGSALAWTTTDWIDVNPEDNDNITGLAVNNNRLIIFKERAMFRWNNETLDPDAVIDVGAVSQETIQTSNGITYFLGRSKKDIGVYAYSGSFPRLISNPVKKFIDAMDMSILSTTSAYVDDDHYGIWIGDCSDVEIAGEERDFTDVILVYTISRDEWTIYTDTPARVFSPFISSGAELIYFGDNDGNVKKFNDPTVFSENGSEIDVEIISKVHTLNEPEYLFTLQDIYVEASRPSNLVIQYREDMSKDWHTFGLLRKFYNYFTKNNKMSRMQLRLADYSKNDCRVEGYVIYAKPSTLEINNKKG